MGGVVERLENVWLESIAPKGKPNGAYRIRGNPFELLDPRNLISDPGRYLSNAAEDAAFLARDGVNRLVRFAEAGGEPLAERMVRLLAPKSFTSTAPFRRLIEETVDFDRIRKSEVELKIIATDWERAMLEIFTNEDMTDAQGADIIIASGSLPGFFPHVPIGDRMFADAGVLGYASWWPAIEAEADSLHVIYTNPKMRDVASGKAEGDLFDTLASLFVAIWDNRKRDSVDVVEGMNQLRTYIQDLIRSGRLSREHAEEIERHVWRHVAGPFKSPSQERSIRREICSHVYQPLKLYSKYHHATPLNLLQFDHSRVWELLRDGYDNTVNHACHECLLPRSDPGSRGDS